MQKKYHEEEKEEEEQQNELSPYFLELICLIPSDHTAMCGHALWVGGRSYSLSPVKHKGVCRLMYVKRVDSG